LFDFSLFRRLSKSPFTIIVENIEGFCTGVEQIARLTAAVLGASPYHHTQVNLQIAECIGIHTNIYLFVGVSQVNSDAKLRHKPPFHCTSCQSFRLCLGNREDWQKYHLIVTRKAANFFWRIGALIWLSSDSSKAEKYSTKEIHLTQVRDTVSLFSLVFSIAKNKSLFTYHFKSNPHLGTNILRSSAEHDTSQS
jgi:hypothetical protein